MFKKLAVAATVAATLAGSAYAQTTTGVGTPTQVKVLSSLPGSSTTVTNYYKQNVYDPADAKIGEISDVLVGQEGKVEAFIISVGGFLELGEKDVAVPFSAVHATQKTAAGTSP
jgi:sporulation protein YlmC with PRC-barrel domain